MLGMCIIVCIATIILSILKFVQWIIGVSAISMFWVFSPFMIAVGVGILFIVLILAIEITRAALWKRG